MKHFKSIKLKSYLGCNVSYCCAVILVDSDHLESSISFNPKHLGYITRIFDNTYDSIFCIWEIQKYKEVT